MMQVLSAGGLELLTDEARRADEHNPRGYFEYESVKSIGRDPRWIRRAQGRAVKSVAPLLPKLSSGYRYRVIFMERVLAEVIASQNAMLEELGKHGANSSPERLPEIYRRQLEAVRESLAHNACHMQVLAVDSHEALAQPRSIAERLNDFLGGGLDCEAMMHAVEPHLRRQRMA